MRYVTCEQMRAIDNETRGATFQFSDVPKEDALMKLAALGAVNIILELCANTMHRPMVFVVFGKGDNGGDAIYVGAELEKHGFSVRYFTPLQDIELRGRVQTLAYAYCKDLSCYHPEWNQWMDAPASVMPKDSIIIDGLLGIGIHGAPREPFAAAIRWVNRHKGRAHIVALDVPSGLNAETGTGAGDAVEADLTVCMGMPKVGMKNPQALQHTGTILVNDLEIAETTLQCQSAEDELVTARDVAGCVPCRAWDAHKGIFGHVAVVGGTSGYCGAPALAAGGAATAGVGLVSVCVPETIATSVASHATEWMVHPIQGDVISVFGLENSRFSVTGKTVVMGPGLSQHPLTQEAVEWMLTSSEASGLVLDADALNVLSGRVGTLAQTKIPCVITPHPGEAARLLGWTVAEVQSNREDALRALVELVQCTVILKGAGSLISAPGEGIHLVASVNPGMAKGGMGDVLAGMVGAYLARGLTPLDAARVGTYLHAQAGLYATWTHGYDAVQVSAMRSQ